MAVDLRGPASHTAPLPHRPRVIGTRAARSQSGGVGCGSGQAPTAKAAGTARGHTAAHWASVATVFMLRAVPCAAAAILSRERPTPFA